MTGLVKILLKTAGAAVTAVTAIVISKNEKERKEWLEERGKQINNAFESVGKTIDKAVDGIKGAIS